MKLKPVPPQYITLIALTCMIFAFMSLGELLVTRAAKDQPATRSLRPIPPEHISDACVYTDSELAKIRETEEPPFDQMYLPQNLTRVRRTTKQGSAPSQEPQYVQVYVEAEYFNITGVIKYLTIAALLLLIQNVVLQNKLKRATSE